MKDSNNWPFDIGSHEFQLWQTGIGPDECLKIMERLMYFATTQAFSLNEIVVQYIRLLNAAKEIKHTNETARILLP